MSKPIRDISALIDSLGGLTAASRFFGERPQTVGNWRLRGQIPSTLYLKHRDMLADAGINAPLDLWSFEPSRCPTTSPERLA